MLQPITLVRYSVRKFERAYVQLLHNRNLFFVMIAFQLLWLAAIAWTGTSTNWSKISLLTLYSVLAGATVILLPATFILKLRDFKGLTLQSEKRVLFTLCLIALIVGILYASQQVPWADEGRTFTVAKVLAADGLEASYWESGWLRNRHPPLTPLVYGLTLNLFGVNLFYLRLVSTLFLIATLVITYLLGCELYDRDTGFRASLLLFSFPLVIRLGASAMMDMQLAFLFTLALLLSLCLRRRPSYRLAVVIGIILGLGLLTKYMMVLIYGVLFTYAVFQPDFRRLKYHLALATLISAAILAIWLSYAYHLGILSGQIQKISDYTGIYHVIRELGMRNQGGQMDTLAVETGNSLNLANSGIIQLGLESLFTRIPSSLGVHHFPLILFGALSLLRRRRASDLFVLLWIGVVFVILFLTLPDHRYFLPAFPAIAILIARSFDRFPEDMERAILLCLLLGVGNLYLFADWVREAHIFLLNP